MAELTPSIRGRGSTSIVPSATIATSMTIGRVTVSRHGSSQVEIPSLSITPSHGELASIKVRQQTTSGASGNRARIVVVTPLSPPERLHNILAFSAEIIGNAPRARVRVSYSEALGWGWYLTCPALNTSTCSASKLRGIHNVLCMEILSIHVAVKPATRSTITILKVLPLIQKRMTSYCRIYGSMG